MSHMTTLGNVLERASNMSRNYADSYIPVKDISFNNLESMNIGNRTHKLRPVAQQSISNRLGIPIQYLRRCDHDIQQYNMNHWIKKEKNEELFFRFDGDDVRAIFTPRYIPTDNLEVLHRLESLNYPLSTRVQCALDGEFMLLSIPDGRQSFSIGTEKMTPGVSISNSEVGLASLSISVFILRLVCTNGMISKTAVSASYKHISDKILQEFPNVLENVSQELGKQKDQFRLSLDSKVDDPEAIVASFNRQFELGKEEREAVEWALPLEYGFTMFHVVNAYTKAAQYEILSAESRYKLQKIGGTILGMVK